MKHFFSKHIIWFILILLMVPTSLHAQKRKMKLPFEEIDYSFVLKDKLIDTHKKAVEINLSEENNKEEKEFYKNNAVYLFQIGGGCFYPKHENISVELNNNTIHIIWKQPNEPCPETGEYLPFFGKIIISKNEYPKYKTMKIKYF